MADNQVQANGGLLAAFSQMLGGGKLQGTANAGGQVGGAQAAQALGGSSSVPGLGGLLKDPNAMAQFFGMMGQAISARDPKSWQYQLGGGAQKLGESGSFRALLQGMQVAQNGKTLAKEASLGSPLTQSPVPTPNDPNSAFNLPTLNALNALSK